MFHPDTQTIALKEQWLADNRCGLALDIDETLSCTNELFFEKLIERFGAPDNLSFEEATAKYYLTHQVPHWQTDEAKQFLIEIRRDANLNLTSKTTPDSVESVRKIQKYIDCLCYVTARPESMRESTTKWLAQNGFPDLPIIMRPESIDDAHISIWKGPTLEFLYPVITGIIDDNPAFSATISPEYQGTLFLYNKHPLPKTHIKTIICPTWPDVVTAVQKYVTHS